MKKLLFYFVTISSLSAAQDAGRINAPGSSPVFRFLKDSARHRYCFAEVNAGIGVPVNDYGSIIKLNNNFLTYQGATQISGFAGIGFHGNITGGILLTKHLGLVAKIGLDISTVDDSIVDLEANPYQSEYYRYHFSQDFKIWQYMMGYYSGFTLYNKSFIWMQAMMGFVLANYPTYTFTEGEPAVEIITYSFKSSLRPGYSISMGFENMITRTLGIISTVSYTATEARYPSYTYSFAGITTTQSSPVYMSIGSIQITAGLNFHI